MLEAWHLPVPPFVVKNGQQLEITLWVQAEAPPLQVLLRAEPDNEEWLLPMAAQAVDGRLCYRASLTLNEGRRRGATALSCCGPNASAGLARGAGR
ncbi:hypothetical protein GGER_11020 [Serratia rubidaea]